MCGTKMPDPLPPTAPPQAAKAPETAPLKRRNGTAGTGISMPSGSTMLTGTSGIDSAMLNLGANTLLGGGTA